MRIRAATVADAPELTALMRAAKRSWGYPDEWMEQWSAALTVDAAAIAAMQVRVAEDESGIVGFYALSDAGATTRLEHLWVRPGQMGRGMGRALLAHARATARAAGASALVIESDPHAEPFYVRMGAMRCGTAPAPMPGAPKRTLPLLRIEFSH